MAITRATNLAAVGSGLGANPAQPIDVGPGIQIDGSSTGIITATTFSGTATNAGTAVNIGVGATGYGLALSGNLTGVAATFTGVITANSFSGASGDFEVSSSGAISVNRSSASNDILVGKLSDTVTSTIEADGSATFKGDITIADKIIHDGDTNTAIRFPAADTFTVETGGSEALRVDSSQRLLLGTTSNAGNYTLQIQGDAASALHAGSINLRRGEAPTSISSGETIGRIYFTDNAGGQFGTIGIEADAAAGTDDFPGRLVFSTTADGASSPTEKLRITSRGGFHFSNGFMNETVKINTTARTGTQAVNLDDGMVHYFSTNSSGTWKPNFTMSAGDDINATIAIGDVFSPTMIVAKGATTHFANAIQVDGSDVTPEFSGGAPTDGGGSGTFDVYNYTIIKTGDDTFKAFAAVSTYE